MNTVDALKKLYKTLAGKDYAGDPNPTDAEMIDAIAADAQSGGSSGGGSTVVLDCTDLEHLPTLEPGLTEEYFLNNVLIKWTQYKIGDEVVPVTARVINISEYDGVFDIMSISSAADNTDTVKWGPALVYNPETGELIND